MVKQYQMISSIFFAIIISLLLGCDSKESDGEIPKINYNDQVKIKVDEKYFNVKIDSMSNILELFPYRIDINSNQLYRYWCRKYEDIIEIRFFNREIYEERQILGTISGQREGYNYLFGIKNMRAFYIRWRNSAGKDEKYRITSDIGKYTVELETNLTENIIKNYFPGINCAVIIKQRRSVKLKSIDLGMIISSNYFPFE